MILLLMNYKMQFYLFYSLINFMTHSWFVNANLRKIALLCL